MFIFLWWKIITFNLYNIGLTCIWNWLCLMPALKSNTYKNQTYSQTFKSSLTFHRPHQFLRIDEVSIHIPLALVHTCLQDLSLLSVESLKYFWEYLGNASHVVTEKNRLILLDWQTQKSLLASLLLTGQNRLLLLLTASPVSY